MGVIVMLGFFWYGLIGVAAIAIPLLIWSGEWTMAHCGRKHRDRWLRQHFGEEGRRRWLANDKKVRGYYYNGDKKPRETTHEEDAERFKYAWRTPDGGCAGVVDEWEMCKPLDREHSFPSWGHDTDEYEPAHGDPYNHRPHIINSHDKKVKTKAIAEGWKYWHGEPRGADWLAAGFWDKGLRDDGVLVDPIAILRADMRTALWENGFLTCDVIADGGKMRNELRDEIKAEETLHPGSTLFGYKGIMGRLGRSY